MTRQLTLALVAVVALSPSLTQLGWAQGRGRGSAPFFPGFNSGRNGTPFVSHYRSEFPGAYYWSGLPLFYDDYLLAPPAPESGPPVIVLQPQSSADRASQPRPSPLLIELEGDRYVRYGGSTQEANATPSGSPPQSAAGSDSNRSSVRPLSARKPGTQSAPRTSAAHAPSGGDNAADVSPSSPAPTILVYRDGHREEVPDYAIVGRVMYAHSIASDTQTGYGLKNIQLSALDLPATAKTNRENGVNFVLPAAPNEVVTRP